MAHPTPGAVLLFYTSSVPNRLRYIVHLLFKEISGLEVTFTQSQEEYLSFEGPKIAYGKEDPGGGLFMESSGLLFEQAIFAHEIPVRRFREIPVLFESTDPDAGFPFDLLAASFYLVSRYEEYISTKKDKYHRFPASSSLAFQGGFLDIPVVNIWLKLFIDRLRNKYPSLMTRQEPYRYLPTIDIDHAFAYRYRSFYRTMGGIGRALSHGRLVEILERLRVLTGISPDPYDTFSFIRSLHEGHQLPTLCFVLFADYGGNDNNIPVDGRGLQALMQLLATWSDVGVHPSLSSSNHPSRLQKEMDGLAKATGKEITRSRQHFLKFSFPATFQHLATLGILDEYSMGYASHSGFRAGIAHPFRFFDLTLNEEKPLRIHPVPVMDVTFRDYLRLTPEESLHEIKQIISQVRLYNGRFISLWHNESLSDSGRWKGWRRLYEEVVAEAAP
ncbi:MAG: polysaccharide deacetylase family protein [Bacteroidales bacterium]|nr:polysaccharide deacetylase family protein [Bacteroidales bacterium]